MPAGEMMRKLVMTLPFLAVCASAEPVRMTRPGCTVYSYEGELFYDIHSNGTPNVYCRHDGRAYDCLLLKGVDGIQDVGGAAITKEIHPDRSSRRWYFRRFETVKRKMSGNKKV